MVDWLMDHVGHVVLFLVVACLVGVGLIIWANSIEAGYVIAKGHNDESYTTTCNKGNCTVTHYPETWSLELSENDDTGWVTVPYQVWAEFDIGEHYPEAK